MEKKNVQRIVGVLVIVALVIIVMPLLFGKNDFPTQQAENTKESTLAQPMDLAANTDSADAALGQGASQGASDPANSNPVEITPNSPQNMGETADANNQINPDMMPDGAPSDASSAKQPTASATNSAMVTSPKAATTNTAQNAALPVPAALDANKKSETTAANNVPAGTLLPNAMATIQNQTTPAANMTKIAADQSAEATAPSTSSDAIAIGKDGSASVVHTAATPASSVHSKKHTHAISSHTSIKAKAIKAKMAKAHSSKKMVAKNMKSPKSPAWVIQMGSFNNKNNAIRLSSKLRSAGFKVFTHEVKSASGKVSTRVYVGPELKEASATKLSTSVHQKMNMQGIVMLYKPVV